ncbi:hypothetical protein Tsp_03122 [Trichinella spiralis]|uniref:hypothetical protein n=1 Tax=Trichinella spiralis TaxID=6334 RepID=UPI0001EFBBCD|nr:hypothetical protein Tsp_03122 [Trichinella spiralis]
MRCCFSVSQATLFRVQVVLICLNYFPSLFICLLRYPFLSQQCSTVTARYSTLLALLTPSDDDGNDLVHVTMPTSMHGMLVALFAAVFAKLNRCGQSLRCSLV